MNRKTPLPPRQTPIRKQSTKQRRRNEEWRKAKVQAITEQIEAFDFAACEGENCPVRFYTVETAMAGLEAHHATFRSHCGANDRTNMRILCADCHESQHGIKVVKEWSDMPVDEGGFDE